LRTLLDRSPDPADRPSWRVSLARRGRSRAANLLQHAVTERQAVFDGFDERELASLAAALDRIDDNVRRLLAGEP
jgi:DNA-binding MarR family transcriptional regulator